jgi:hypothetical protein
VRRSGFEQHAQGRHNFARVPLRTMAGPIAAGHHISRAYCQGRICWRSQAFVPIRS